MTYEQVMRRLRALGDPAAVAGMARFGINPQGTLGVPVPALRRLARELGTDRALARRLWASGVHEARILASMVEDPARVTRAQMDRWARAFDSWDVCDQCCLNLFRRSPHARAQALDWSGRSEPFVKRAGFALMAVLAVHDRQAPDPDFEPFLEDHAHTPALGRDEDTLTRQQPPAHAHAARVRSLETGDQTQQRGLAAAARADQRQHLARRGLQIDARHRRPAVVGQRQPVQLERRARAHAGHPWRARASPSSGRAEAAISSNAGAAARAKKASETEDHTSVASVE